PLNKIPGIHILIALWVGYTLLVGPGLYLLLKRFNRRSLAWLAVPAAAILTAMCFNAISPVNRLQAYLSHTVSTLEIIDQNLAELRSSGTILLPRGGSLEVSGTGQMMLDQVRASSGKPVSVFIGDNPRVVFSDVEYGSMRQVYSYGTMQGAGMINGNIYLRDDQVMGRVTNNTQLNLRDCGILIGSSLINLGEIPAGGVKDLDEPLNRSKIVNLQEFYSMGPQPSAMSRESMVISDFSRRKAGSGEIDFIGWSDSPVSQLKVADPSGQGQSSGLTLIRQKMGLEFPKGLFRLPPGFVKCSLSGLGGGYSENPNGLLLHSGSVKITYDLPGTLNAGNFKVTGIEINQSTGKYYYVDIYNQSTSVWERLDPNSKKISGQGAL
ncbi:MAG: hypothetical protein ACYDEQ_07585, partial [Desulfocucumaceae bacterium]